MRGVIAVARRLFLAYVAVVVGPLAVAAAAFAVRDLLVRRNGDASRGNGHALPEGLEHTVEEVRATS